MPTINLENLIRYDSKAKNEAEEEYMPVDSGNWQKTEKAGAVSFYPVENSPLEGKVKFSFKETPPAEGDKSPSNPSTISGVPNIHITRCGKNLLQLKNNYSFPYFDHGITYADNGDGTYTANGTCPADGTNDSWLYFAFSGSSSTWLYRIPVYASVGKYVISGCPSGGSSSTYMIGTQTRSAARANDFGSGGVLTVSRDEWTNFFIKIMKGQTVSNMKFAPQFEAGDTPTAFEKPEYDNYTVDLGGTYYGGEIDLATGLMTVTWWGHVFDGSEAMTLIQTYPDVSMISTSLSGTSPQPATIVTTTDNTAFCTHYPHLHNWGNHTSFAVHFNGIIRFFTPLTIASTAAELQAFFASQYANGTPIVLTYPVLTPTTLQLTPTQILSLSQTDKCMPRLNTVYTDAEAIQIGYMKSPKRTEQEITQALLELESS